MRAKLVSFRRWVAVLGNATGFPAISLPLCQSADGLPIGMQFMAGFGKEALLMRVAAAFEEALPWIGRRPPVHVGNLANN